MVFTVVVWFMAWTYWWTALSSCGEDAESKDGEEEDVQPLSTPGKHSGPGSNAPQRKAKHPADEDDEEDDGDADDDDFDEEKADEKALAKKSIGDAPPKNSQKSNQTGKDSQLSTPRSKGQNPSKNRKIPGTPKEPSSEQDIKAHMQEITLVGNPGHCG